MNEIYDCKDNLSNKSDEELFYIYRGYPNHRPIEERYMAARILESRDFQFKDIHQHIQQWDQKKFANSSTNGKLNYSLLFKKVNVINLLMFIALIILSALVVIPTFFPNVPQTFKFDGDIWFLLNALSFLVFIYIFGFISYFVRIIQNFRKRRKTFHIFNQQTTSI